MTNHQLIKEMKQGSVEASQTLFSTHCQFLKAMTQRFAEKSSLSQEALIAAAKKGMLEAALHWDPRKDQEDAGFLAYSVWYINVSLFREIHIHS